MNKYSSNKKLL